MTEASEAFLSRAANAYMTIAEGRITTVSTSSSFPPQEAYFTRTKVSPSPTTESWYFSRDGSYLAITTTSESGENQQFIPVSTTGPSCVFNHDGSNYGYQTLHNTSSTWYGGITEDGKPTAVKEYTRLSAQFEIHPRNATSCSCLGSTRAVCIQSACAENGCRFLATEDGINLIVGGTLSMHAFFELIVKGDPADKKYCLQTLHCTRKHLAVIQDSIGFHHVKLQDTDDEFSVFEFQQVHADNADNVFKLYHPRHKKYIGFQTYTVYEYNGSKTHAVKAVSREDSDSTNFHIFQLKPYAATKDQSVKTDAPLFLSSSKPLSNTESPVVVKHEAEEALSSDFEDLASRKSSQSGPKHTSSQLTVAFENKAPCDETFGRVNSLRYGKSCYLRSKENGWNLQVVPRSHGKSPMVVGGGSETPHAQFQFIQDAGTMKNVYGLKSKQFANKYMAINVESKEVIVMDPERASFPNWSISRHSDGYYTIQSGDYPNLYIGVEKEGTVVVSDDNTSDKIKFEILVLRHEAPRSYSDAAGRRTAWKRLS